MPVKVAEEWLNICGGCEVTILNIGEPLLDLLPKLEFVHMPVLMDHKYFGQTGEKAELEIPEADIGIISGGIRNEKEKHVTEEMRKKCKTLISLGSCACFGGIPALPNHNALISLLEGKPFVIPERSVCDDCPTKREKKAITSIKRPLESIVPPGQKLEDSRCFMELGYLCLGPITKSGCGGSEKTPRCIKAFMPCRGCFGPIRAGANPMVEMMGALSSIGLDPKLILDRSSTFQRYIGAHGKLRPLPKRP